MTRPNTRPFQKPAPAAVPASSITEAELAELERLHNIARRAAEGVNDYKIELAQKYKLGEGDSISWTGKIIRAPKT